MRILADGVFHLSMSLPHQATTERDWIARIRAGDAVAFDTVFRSYHAELCGFAYRYVRSRALAEDLVHDVFADIWAKREQWQVRSLLKSYLYSAVRNRAISLLRRQIVERRWSDGVEARQRVLPQYATNDAQDELERQDLVRVVREVLDGLPERCRMAATLRWQRGLSYAEIGEAMGIAVKTVDVYIGRASRELRARYMAMQADRSS